MTRDFAILSDLRLLWLNGWKLLNVCNISAKFNSQDLWQWRYKCNQRVVMWLFGWKLLVVCNHPTKFVSNKPCGGGDMTNFHLSRDFVPLDQRAIWLYVWKPGSHGPSYNGEMFLIFHEILQNYADKKVTWLYGWKPLTVSHHPT